MGIATSISNIAQHNIHLFPAKLWSIDSGIRCFEELLNESLEIYIRSCFINSFEFQNLIPFVNGAVTGLDLAR